MIGVVSLFGRNNYGNSLQRHAVHELVTSFGYKAVTLHTWKLSRGLISDHILDLLAVLPRRSMAAERRRRFLAFDREIPVRRIPKRLLHWYSQRLIAVIAGSDQIWNPQFYEFDPYVSFLEFASEKKRIAFAPSFGVGVINAAAQDMVRSGLEGFERLSVRETRGAAITASLLSKSCDVLADPTCALGFSHWESVASSEHVPNEPYILCYQLGTDSGCFREASVSGNNHGYRVIEMNNPKNKYFACGPSDFVGLIFGAKAVYTDSFHAAVFSIIGHVPFKVLVRGGSKYSMSSRFDSIQERFGIALDDIDQQYNWDEVDGRLQQSAHQARAYLSEEFGRISEATTGVGK